MRRLLLLTFSQKQKWRKPLILLGFPPFFQTETRGNRTRNFKTYKHSIFSVYQFWGQISGQFSDSASICITQEISHLSIWLSLREPPALLHRCNLFLQRLNGICPNTPDRSRCRPALLLPVCRCCACRFAAVGSVHHKRLARDIPCGELLIKHQL